jgi:hypothetical protein
MVLVLLTIVGAALDLGRRFMDRVVLDTALRVGASQAGLHREAWGRRGGSARRAT